MRKFTTPLFIALLASASVAAAETRPFDLYQPIIDRAPFGKPPPGFDPTDLSSSKPASGAAAEDPAQLSKEQEQLQKSINATALVVDAARTVWIGFTDTTDPKSPRNHYVPVGSSEDGWLVESADPDTKSVTFVKDGVSIDVVIGKDGGKGSATAPAADAKGAAKDASAAVRKSPLLSRGAADAAPASMRSLRQMRREREAAESEERNAAVAKAREAALAEAKRQREEEAAKRAEEEAARDAERAAEREELRERLKNLSADIEKRMAESRAAADEGEENGEEE